MGCGVSKWLYKAIDIRQCTSPFAINSIKKILLACDYVRIVCSLCNAFRPALMRSLETDAVLAKRMMTLAKSPNKLQQKVIENTWDQKRIIWKTMDESEMPDPPQLTEAKLRALTIGVSNSPSKILY